MSDQSGFQLSGSAPENYERYAWVILEPFVRKMLDAAPPRPGVNVLDVACGTGSVARTVSSVLAGDGSVEGLDINPGMLRTAAALANDEGHDITWHEASAEQMPLPDESFDIVYCSMGIMFFPDLRRGLAELVRVARTTGQIVLTFFASLDQNPYFVSFAMHLEPLCPGMEQMNQQAFRLEAQEVASALADLGLEKITAETLEISIALPALREYLPVHIGGLPIAAEFEAHNPQTKDAYYRQMETDLMPFSTADGLHVPFTIHMVSGIKP